MESRLNVSHKEHSHYHTLECVASTEGEEAYTLFSISGTVTLSRNVATGGCPYFLLEETPTHRPTDLGPAKARCLDSGYRLNEIRTC